MNDILGKLAQAGTDALVAAEQRGFERALAQINAKLASSPHLCIYVSPMDAAQCMISIEISDEEGSDDLLIQTKKMPLSDVIYGQYPECKGSVKDVAGKVRASLTVVDGIIQNWGKGVEDPK